MSLYAPISLFMHSSSAYESTTPPIAWTLAPLLSHPIVCRADLLPPAFSWVRRSTDRLYFVRRPADGRNIMIFSTLTSCGSRLPVNRSDPPGLGCLGPPRIWVPPSALLPVRIVRPPCYCFCPGGGFYVLAARATPRRRPTAVSTPSSEAVHPAHRAQQYILERRCCERPCRFVLRPLLSLGPPYSAPYGQYRLIFAGRREPPTRCRTTANLTRPQLTALRSLPNNAAGEMLAGNGA